jgi:hypothetical protein
LLIFKNAERWDFPRQLLRIRHAVGMSDAEQHKKPAPYLRNTRIVNFNRRFRDTLYDNFHFFSF